MGEKGCILYGKNHFTALRLGELLKSRNLKFMYSNNIGSLKGNILSMNNDLICIFVEIDNNEDATDLIEDAKNSSDKIPLIVLSDDPRRALFIKAILAGATDFIVKPYEEGLLLDKIFKIMDIFYDENINQNETAIEMIRIELIKSKKGKYPLGFVLITLFKPKVTYNAKLEQQYRKDLPKVFEGLGSNLFETDIKLLIGSQSMLVTLNFCSNNQIPLVENKMTELYEKIKIDNLHLKDYLMVQAFITEFESISEPVEILNSLMNQTKNAIVDHTANLNTEVK